MGVLHTPVFQTPRACILALASVLLSGCSSHTLPRPVERDPCLDAGPVNTVGYDHCVAERDRQRKEALEALLDDDPAHLQRLQVIEMPDSKYQPSDFPDTPIPLSYRGVDSISLAEKQALPFKARIVWKYSSARLIPERRDALQMEKMQVLIMSAVQENGLAKWICTATGGQQREWIFYTQSDEAFIAKVRAALAQTGPYPIELKAQRDVTPTTLGQAAQDIRVTPKLCME
ncbi:DUF695 domain-containing protein [Pseudomonas sp. NPDC087803]|uniref:DUF695 domain-containing protein n=1 Tax=Pseudomonas sp. NPDC087803 TaxID=3364448 RepID=UPI0037FFC247